MHIHRGRIGMSAVQGLISLLEAIAARQVARRPSAVAPADIALVSGYDDRIASYAKGIADNNIAYARRHGYASYVHTGGFSRRRHPSWSKILFVLQALRRHRWALWCDADALVMDHAKRIEDLLDPRFDLIFARWGGPNPPPHVNCGVFLVQNTVFARAFLHAAWWHRSLIHHFWWEQGAINHMLDSHRFDRVKQVAQYRDFNAFVGVRDDPDPYRPGDFIAHLSGFRDTEGRIQASRDFLKNVSP
jgi:hypothetical protein